VGEAWGLGWEVPRRAEPMIVGHGGNTNGHASQLYLVPDRGLAVCVLTNGDMTGRLREDLCDEVLSPAVGVTLAHRPTPAPKGTQVDLTPFVGSYGREDLRFTFRATDGVLEADFLPGRDTERTVGSFTVALPYVSGSGFLLTIPGSAMCRNYSPSSGRAVVTAPRPMWAWADECYPGYRLTTAFPKEEQGENGYHPRGRRAGASARCGVHGDREPTSAGTTRRTTPTGVRSAPPSAGIPATSTRCSPRTR